MVYIHTAFFICPSVSAKNRPGFLSQKPGRSYTLLVLSQALTPLLAGVLDRSLGGCQNYRAFGITTHRGFQFSVDSKLFHQLRTALFIFGSPLYIVNAILVKKLLHQQSHFVFTTAFAFHDAFFDASVFHFIKHITHIAWASFPASKSLRVQKIRSQHLNQFVNFRSGC